MKNIFTCFRSVLILIVLLLIGKGSYASHIIGADLYYTWVSGNTYRITLILYGDCSPASSAAFSALPSSAPQICIFRGTTNVGTINLAIQAPTSGVDITPVCPANVGHTQCQNPSSTIPGIMKFVYSANYTLPAPTVSNCWQFAYFGNNGTVSAAGRTASITNIVSPGSTYIQLVDTLNNTVYPSNSSAQFSVVPMPFFCLNNSDSYNPGAVDPDFDNLNIDLINAKNSATSTGCMFGPSVTYVGTAWTPPTTPVSATTPLRVIAGSYSYNPLTGQLNFIPNAIQRATVVYNAREYRGGSFVGSCQREMNFLVTTCTTNPPIGGIDSAIGGTMDDSTHFHVCTNSGPFSLHFNPEQPGTTNSITVTYSGIPAGSGITVVGNGTPHPHVTFSWTSTGVAPGTYVFYLTYTDNNCPLSGTNTVAITVTIAPPPTVSYTILSAAPCHGKAAVSITPTGTGSPWNINIAGTTTHSFTGVSGPFIDSLPPGTDTIFISSAAASGCGSYTLITIVSMSSTPPLLSSNTPCNDSTLYLVATDTATGVTYSWTGPNGFTATTQNPTISPVSGLTAGVYTVVATKASTNCASISTLSVVVKPTPLTPVLTGNAPCNAGTLALNATSSSGSTYSWNGPAGFTSLLQNPSISPVGLSNAGTYTVTATLNGCPSLPGMGTFTVYPTPALPIVSDTSYCQYETTDTITAVGSNLLWYTVATSGTGNPIAPIPQNNTAGVITWYVSQTINGCEGPRAPVAVAILYVPVFDIGGIPKLCIGTSTTLSYSGPTLVSPDYLWTLPVGATIISGSNTSDVVTIKFDSTLGQNVTLSVKNYGGKCSATKTIHVEVVKPPLSHFYIKPDFCVGDTVVVALSDKSPTATEFAWDFDGAIVVTANSNSGGPYSLSWPDTGIHIIKMTTATDIGCITPPVYDTFNVHGLPNAEMSIPKPDICLGDTITLSAKYNKYQNTYTWEPAHFFNYNDQPVSNNGSSVNGMIQARGYVTLTVTDPFGCRASDIFYFDPKACCTVNFPSAFTPNDDNLNDVFRPIFAGYHRFHIFRIVNRWGQTVFETTNTNYAWDGSFNGVPQDIGVYYYFLKYDCGGSILEAKGDVTLIR